VTAGPRHTLGLRACFGVATLVWASLALADDAIGWLQQAATAAKQLNYAGTLVYSHDGRVETSRVMHMVDATGEHEKLVNLDGPAREVIRNNEQVRCYYPDAKIIRIEPRTYRNAFPSLLPQQLDTLAGYYFFRKAEIARILGCKDHFDLNYNNHRMGDVSLNEVICRLIFLIRLVQADTVVCWDPRAHDEENPDH